MISLSYAPKAVLASVFLMACLLIADSILAAKPVKPQPTTTGVVDSTGKAVGKLMGTFRQGASNSGDVPLVYADVALQLSGQQVVVSVDKYQFYGNAQLWFTGSDCTGQAYFEGHIINGAPRLFPAIGFPPNLNVAYLANIDGNVTAVPVSSFTSFRSGHLSTYCQPNSTTLTDAVEAINVGDLSTIYQPPFSLQVAP